MRNRARLTAALKLAVGLAVIGALVVTGRLSPQNLRSVDLSVVLLVVAPLLALNLLAQALRWWCLLRAHRLDVSVARSLQIAWIGNLFSMVLPGAVGGELARVYYLWRRQPQRRLAVTLSVLADRGLGLLFLFLLAALAFSIWGAPTRPLEGLGVVSVAFVIAAAVAAAVVAMPLSRRWIVERLSPSWAAAAGRELSAYRRASGWLSVAALLSLVAATAMMAAYWSGAAALGEPLGVRATVTTVPFVVAANSVPISPGGLGVGESVASAILEGNGYVLGAELALLVRLVLTLLRAIGVVPFLLHRP